MATKLSALPSGRALDVYCNFSEEAASNYGKVKIALIKRYDLIKDGYRCKFRVSMLKTDKNSDQFYSSIINLPDSVARAIENGEDL